jgi:hypothetical protein
MKDYRRIWIKANGPIPLDEQGRKYDIHHIDGNRENSELSNLQCVSMEEHLNIHISRGDWGAAFRIGQRMDIDPIIKSDLMSKSNKKRLEEGNHPFLQEEFKRLQKKAMNTMINNNKHPFQNPEVIKKAIKIKQEKYNHEELSQQTKKGWELWKENNPNADRTTKGSKVGAEKTKGTKWYHKEDGTQLRTTPDNPRIISENWLQGRFEGKELSIKANLCKLNKKNKQL